MEKEIGKIAKNPTSDIVIRIDDFGGKRGLTIREFVTSDRYTGFTKAGVRISAADFPKFKEMINSVSVDEMAESPEESEGGQEKLNKPEKSRGIKKEPVKSKEPEEDLPDY
ncbi:MAG TPA: hypothetical protein VJH65_01765 [Candidatus Nanoarchaeia archaeon]|nr:hypothetical protein [Candidatus Nanoarchaeia archaeon]